MIPRTASGRWLAGITAVVGGLVVISLVVALATGSDEAPLLPADTPEGTVQRYVRALQTADYAAAHALLSEDAREHCPIEEFRRQQRFGRNDDVRTRLGATRPAGDDVEVTVHVTRFSASPPFGVSEFTSESRYLLTETDAGWRIVDAPWPFGCALTIERGLPAAPPTPTPTPTSPPAAG
ncbi:MAG: nuclear transport factor 2 family protein [Chloroflexi bacterium]|nr:nuclear transport factor 2 family protein [Chloroflexota bacterium]